jgi:hypothetical protein
MLQAQDSPVGSVVPEDLVQLGPRTKRVMPSRFLLLLCLCSLMNGVDQVRGLARLISSVVDPMRRIQLR